MKNLIKAVLAMAVFAGAAGAAEFGTDVKGLLAGSPAVKAPAVEEGLPVGKWVGREDGTRKECYLKIEKVMPAPAYYEEYKEEVALARAGKKDDPSYAYIKFYLLYTQDTQDGTYDKTSISGGVQIRDAMNYLEVEFKKGTKIPDSYMYTVSGTQDIGGGFTMPITGYACKNLKPAPAK